MHRPVIWAVDRLIEGTLKALCLGVYFSGLTFKQAQATARIG